MKKNIKKKKEEEGTERQKDESCILGSFGWGCGCGWGRGSDGCGWRRRSGLPAALRTLVFLKAAAPPPRVAAHSVDRRACGDAGMCQTKIH